MARKVRCKACRDHALIFSWVSARKAVAWDGAWYHKQCAELAMMRDDGKKR
jgi:hypothetical protein